MRSCLAKEPWTIALPDPRPHPKSGIYWSRQRVPKHLVELVGKREEKRSLETRNLAEARIRQSAIERERMARWKRLEAGVVDLTIKQCRAIGGELFRRRIAEFEDHVEDPLPWRREAERHDADMLLLSRRGTGLAPDAATIAAALCRPPLDAFLAKQGLVLSPSSYLVAVRIAAASLKAAAEHLEQAALGNYGDTGRNAFPPPLRPPRDGGRVAPPKRLGGLRRRD